MSSFPEPGRQVAHIMLDSVVAVGFDDQDATKNTAATNLALQRINDVKDGIPVTMVGDEVGIDLTNMFGAAMILLNRAVSELAFAREVDPDLIVAELREYMDR